MRIKVVKKGGYLNLGIESTFYGYLRANKQNVFSAVSPTKFNKPIPKEMWARL